MATDLDLDSSVDIVVLERTTPDGAVIVLHGDGQGSFSAADRYPVIGTPNRVEASDLDGSGAQDLVVAGWGVFVLLSDDSGGFQPPVQIDTPPAYHLAVGDVDGDGVPDLVVPDEDQQATVLRGDGNGGFTPGDSIDVGMGMGGITLALVDADDLLDLVVRATSDRVGVLLGDGVGGFGPTAEFDVFYEPVEVAIGDMNCDGAADLLTVSSQGPITILLGDGAGSFPTRSDIGLAGWPLTLEVGDLNADKVPDIVMPEQFGDSRILYGLGTGVDYVVTELSGEFVHVGLADLDGSGSDDLALASASGMDMVVLLTTP